MAVFTSAELQLTQTELGQVSKLIFESFLKFVLRVEETGKRNVNQWAQKQIEAGENTITGLLLWAAHLCQKPVFYSS